MNRHNVIHVSGPQHPAIACPVCGSSEIETHRQETTIEYGTGATPAQIPVTLPVRVCSSCEFEFLDDEADRIRHEAICSYLGVMTPDDIATLRARHSLSRAEFARLTRLGEATLGRWERGELIQNGANDNYLYLLTFSENLLRIRQRRSAPRPSDRAPRPIPFDKFRTLSRDDQVRRRAGRFELVSGRVA